jgi:GNAT superfamily N-acetyltransferase
VGRAAALDLQLRTATAADRDFFKRVYASTREPELAWLGWSEAARQGFIDMQFDAQERHYARHFPQARQLVILTGECPAGRLCIDEDEQQTRLIDIALLPDHRGQGLGRRCLQALLADADRTHHCVHLHVETHNPVRHWYEQLGFVPTGAPGVYLAMTRYPTGA